MSLCVIHLLLQADTLNYYLKYLSVTEHCLSYFSINTLCSADSLNREQWREMVQFKVYDMIYYMIYEIYYIIWYYMIYYIILYVDWAPIYIIDGNHYPLVRYYTDIHNNSSIRKHFRLVDRKALYQMWINAPVCSARHFRKKKAHCVILYLK